MPLPDPFRGALRRLTLGSCFWAASLVIAEEPRQKVPRVAAIVTEYRHNSHADMIVSRLLQTETLNGQGRRPEMTLASLYTDQVPANDISRMLSQQYRFPIYDRVADALTLGTGELAVDGVLLVAEHGKYPKSDTGQTIYPKRRLFSEIAQVFEESGRGVPVFIDKHLADNWRDAKWIYDTAHRWKAPLMAGSSLPVTWRYPAHDLPRGAEVKEIVAVSYHTLDAYGFHALEMVQALLERRAGGETGVAYARCLEGEAVWEAGQRGVYDPALLQAAIATFRERPLRKDKPLRELVKNPTLFIIEYRDGHRASVLTLNGAAAEWASAWRYKDGRVEATLFWPQDQRPYSHFAHQLRGVERMMRTGEPTWPVERTLLTSGLLNALLISRRDGGARIETPYLALEYQSRNDWRQPPPPPEAHRKN